MFLANKKTDNQVKTHITYNRGRDWRLLQAPSKDLRANSIHCVLVSVCRRAAFVRVVTRGHLFQSERLNSERAVPVKADCSEAAELKGQLF